MPTENAQKKKFYSVIIPGESVWIKFFKAEQAVKLAGLKLVSRDIIWDSLQR